jgi:hypothetical protein
MSETTETKTSDKELKKDVISFMSAYEVQRQWDAKKVLKGIRQ